MEALFRKFIISTFIVLIKFYVENANCVGTNSTIFFDNNDITKFATEGDERIQLEAFKYSANDEIIRRNNTNEYGKLMWVSLGHPRIVKTPSIQNKAIYKIFHFTNDGFYTHIQMLTEKHQKLIVEGIKEKYKIELSTNQVFNLIVNSFHCSINSFFDTYKIAFSGKVADFRTFPLRMEFLVNVNSNERNAFQKLLEYQSEELIDLGLECEILHSKEVETKVFAITSKQITDFEINEKLFGTLDTVYFTREQLNSLAREIYMSLDVEEEYEITISKFSELFVNQLTSLSGSNQVGQILLEKAKNSLSNYSRDYEEFKIYDINNDLSKLFEINNINGADYIHLNNHSLESLIEQLKIIEFPSYSNSLIYLGFIEINGCIRNVLTKLNDWMRSKKSINEQLKHLNTEIENDIQWKIVGGRIIPKSISVVKLNKNLFAKTIKFNKIRKELYNPLLKRKFTLYTTKHTLQESNNTIKNNLNEFKTLANYTVNVLKDLNKIQNTVNSIMNALDLCLNKRNAGNYILKQILSNHSSSVRSLVNLPHGDLVSGFNDGIIKIWNTNDGSVKKTLTGHNNTVYSLVVLPNGDLVSGSWDNTIKIWNTNDGTVKKTLEGHTDDVETLVILPNGDLASASDDRTIKIWNTNDGSLKRILVGHTSRVWSLVSLPDGDLASGSEDKTIKIWNTNDGTLKKTLIGHNNTVYTLIVLPNGDLASGSADKTIKLWNINDGTVKKTLTGHNNNIYSLVVLPNGDLASGSEDKTIKIWNTNDGTLKKTLIGHSSTVHSLGILPSGGLVSGSADYTIRIWEELIIL